MMALCVSRGMRCVVTRTRAVTRTRDRASCRAYRCAPVDVAFYGQHVGTAVQSQCEALAKLVYAVQDTDRIVVANDVIRFAFLALVFAMVVLKK